MTKEKPATTMQRHPTRQKIIEIIIDIHFNRGDTLRVGKVAEEAGITRQAFHRYYSDLISYIKGDSEVGDLLPTFAPDSINQLLQISQAKVSELENKLAQSEDRHKAQLKSTLDRYITSLMNNDITLFETDSVRITLDKQTTYISHLIAQLDQVKAELTKAKLNSVNGDLMGTPGARIVFQPNLNPAFKAYQKDGNYKTYLGTKSKEIAKVINQVNQHETTYTQLIIFADRFISSFEDFLKQLPEPRSDEIVIRLPVFSSMELKNQLRKVNKTAISIYVPECASVAETAAQRKFRSNTVPAEEILAAQKADHIHLFKGIDRVVHFNTNKLAR